MTTQAQTMKRGKSISDAPFVQPDDISKVWAYFADRQTKLLSLDRVPQVTRAMGLTVYGDEEANIVAELEKTDGVGKPISYDTMKTWAADNQKHYIRSYDDAYNAVSTLCHQGIIGDTSGTIKLPHLRHLVNEVGDKIDAAQFDKIMSGLPNEVTSIDEFLDYLRK
uniref:Uncharacterized protein n=1 Tax=Noctiluca scintillans TaxID=2966 RepID=A7WQA5_NOCSC|nr:unknown [Noctiluca scintillans]